MSELLCVLGFVLLVITVVGHVLWLLAAAVLRALFGDLSAAPTPRPAAAQAQLTQPKPVAEQAARAARRQTLVELLQRLDRWQSEGVFTALQAGTLRGWIEQELRQVGPAEARPDSWRWPAIGMPRRLVHLLVALLVMLAVRSAASDPQQPWWSVGTLAGTAVVAAATAVTRWSTLWAWGSWGLVGLTNFVSCLSPGGRQWLGAIAPGRELLVGGELILLTLVTAAGGWLAVELAWQRRGQPLPWDRQWPRTCDLAIGWLVPACVVWRWLYALVAASAPPVAGADHGWALVGTLALGGLVAGTLWDRRAWYSLPAAYGWGIACWGVLVALIRDQWLLHMGAMALSGSGLSTTGPVAVLPGPPVASFAFGEARELLSVLACVALAIHTAASGQLWFHGVRLAIWGRWLGIPEPLDGLKRADRWLPMVQTVLTAVVCLVALRGVLQAPSLALRVAAAMTPAVTAWGLACLAQGRREERMQWGTLLVAGLSAVLLSWSERADRNDWSLAIMNRVFRLLMVLCGLTFGYGLVLPQTLWRGSSWAQAARKVAVMMALAAGATLVVTFSWEVALFKPGTGTPASAPQVLAVAVLMALGAAGLLTLALLPGRDPLNLQGRDRQAYVYAAEAVLVLAGAHLYLCRPQWFDSGLRPYWPLIVLGIAFAGSAAAELAQRWHLAVLSEPLQRTGQLLPVLPVLGWWVVGSHVDYAVLLLGVGLLYLVLSWRWESGACGVAGVVAGQAALWRWLSEKDVTLISNPQLWLVPPALSVLVAAQWHRQRLKPQTLTAIRYAATLVIYVSSTSEIMIRGFADSLGRPMLLLALAVLGALAGIALRVRAFLILGTSFTFVALLAMIRHAQQAIGHVWPWWVFGIALGVAILTLLGLFEKKREAWQRLAQQISEWE